jgi:trans-aconitate methyltransferase
MSTIGAFYDSLVDRYGHQPKACDYGQEASQRIKFEVLSRVLHLSGKKVLDVGCGFADYATFLHERYGTLNYTGIDVSRRMVEEARKLHPDRDIRHCHLLDMQDQCFDVVTCNGIFYLLGSEARVMMERMIERMYSMATEAVALNSLSAWAPDQQEGEFYADPIETADFCRRLTPHIVLRHDYHSRDFTLYLYKQELMTAQNGMV